MAITDGRTEDVVRLFDQETPMIIEHFVLAIQKRHYHIFKLFLNRGWDINASRCSDAG